MDNSTLAIVIVGSVVVALIVASISIMAFNSAQEGFNQESSNTNNQRVAIFNSQYESFFGENRSREQAAAVCSLAENNNKMGDAPFISCPSSSSYEDVDPLSLYTIRGEYDSDTGYINQIIIN